MLKSVILSSGRERHYEYNGVLMTQIRDENGYVLIHNWFRERFLQRQLFGDGAAYSYSYDWAPDEYYPKRVRVTLPDKATQELSVGASVPEFVKNYHR
jgi:hypothetical protein